MDFLLLLALLGWVVVAFFIACGFGHAESAMKHDDGATQGLLPALRAVLRQRAQGIAHWWRERVMRSLYRCVPWFRASNKPN